VLVSAPLLQHKKNSPEDEKEKKGVRAIATAENSLQNVFYTL
jgi:hypothetical protein